MNNNIIDDVKAYKSGLEYLKKGDFDNAVKMFRIAASSGEDRPMEHYTLAAALIKKGDTEGALRELKYYLSMNPPKDNYYRAALTAIAKIEGKKERHEHQAEGDKIFEEGLNAYMQGDLERAYNKIKSAIDAGFKNADAFNALGAVLLDKKLYSDALKVLKQGLEINTSHVPCMINLATALLENGLDKAIKTLERAVEIDQSNSDALYNLAMLYLKRNKRVKARKMLERALAASPSDKNILAMLKKI